MKSRRYFRRTVIIKTDTLPGRCECGEELTVSNCYQCGRRYRLERDHRREYILIAARMTLITCAYVAHALDISREQARRILRGMSSAGLLREERLGPVLVFSPADDGSIPNGIQHFNKIRLT